MTKVLSAAVMVLGLGITAAGFGQSGKGASNTGGNHGPAAHRAVVFVMPNALMTSEAGNSSQVVVDSAHNGREPQIAKVYQELQHNKKCQDFSENMIKDNADYFLLLQHGGGRGNRWALSSRNGNVIASGESFTLGGAVGDACSAMAKDWKSLGPAAQ
ncbi:MAG TPA: hypothetical protein VL523_05175 [Terriglobia bacterium]|nr:hypothetical protein [Terriglobia bacterium]